MCNSSEKDLVVNRFLSDEVFKKFENDLRELFIKSRETNKLNIHADFWDMQFKNNNTITLYYKGCGFNFELAVNENEATYKLWISKSLKIHLDKFIDKNVLNEIYNKPINIEIKSLSNFFMEHKSKFENAVKDSSYNHGEKERKRQQYIAALLQNNTDCIVIDYESNVENIPEELSRITFNKECKISSDKDAKTYKKLDLLVLKKNNTGKYEFISVEIRMDGNKGYREAICKVNAYTRILKDKREDFITCYQKVAKQKSKLGMLNYKFKKLQTRDIERDISKSLAIVLYDHEISERAQKEKKLKEISKKCEKACGFKNQIIDVVAVALEEDNDAVNRKKIRNIFMGKTLGNSACTATTISVPRKLEAIVLR